MLNHCHWSECFTTIIFQIIPDLGFLTMWSAAQACCHACIYIASYGEDFCTFYEDERSTDCSTDWNKGQTVAFQGNFEPWYTFWSCMYMWLVYWGCLPAICCVYCAVYLAWCLLITFAHTQAIHWQTAWVQGYIIYHPPPSSPPHFDTFHLCNRLKIPCNLTVTVRDNIENRERKSVCKKIFRILNARSIQTS